MKAKSRKTNGFEMAGRPVFRSLFFLLLVLVLAASFFAPASRPALAQQATPSDDEVNDIARQLYCPVCENTPLDVCPTQACHDWRELIRQMLAEGKSAEEITQYFVDNYGARVLSTPPRTGLNWLVYIVPPVAFLAGVFLLIQAFRTWKRTAAVQPAKTDSTDSSTDDPYIARLEEELRKRK